MATARSFEVLLIAYETVSCRDPHTTFQHRYETAKVKEGKASIFA
jgi:hypothetical protein